MMAITSTFSVGKRETTGFLHGFWMVTTSGSRWWHGGSGAMGPGSLLAGWQGWGTSQASGDLEMWKRRLALSLECWGISWAENETFTIYIHLFTYIYIHLHTFTIREFNMGN